MNLIAGIIVAAIGLAVALLSITGAVPGLTSTGVIMILFGGLIIGLSFIDKPNDEGAEKMSTASMFGNIFFAPADVFKNLRRHPRWLAAVLVMSVLSATYLNLFYYRLGPDRVANFTIDKTLEMPIMNEAAKEGIESGRAAAIAEYSDPAARAGAAVSGFAGLTFLFTVLAFVFFLFVLAMGGKINFWQAFSAGVYAALPVSIIRFVLNTIILFVRDPADVHPILGQQSLIQDNLNFLVAPSESPIIYTLLSSLSVLGFYWLWLNAIGLKNTGERVTGTVAWSASITVFVVTVLLGLITAVLFPSFLS